MKDSKIVRWFFTWITMSCCIAFVLTGAAAILWMVAEFVKHAPVWAAIMAGCLLITAFIAWLEVCYERAY